MQTIDKPFLFPAKEDDDNKKRSFLSTKEKVSRNRQKKTKELKRQKTRQ